MWHTWNIYFSITPGHDSNAVSGCRVEMYNLRPPWINKSQFQRMNERIWFLQKQTWCCSTKGAKTLKTFFFCNNFCQHNWLRGGHFSILQHRIELVSSGWLNFDAQKASKIKFLKDKFTRMKRKIGIKNFLRGVRRSIADYY